MKKLFQSVLTVVVALTLLFGTIVTFNEPDFPRVFSTFSVNQKGI